jgi:type I protein arginine methyltransferase
MFNYRQSYDVTIELTLEGTSISSYNTLDLKNPFFRYTGVAQVPPGNNTTSPSEQYWKHMEMDPSKTGKRDVLIYTKRHFKFKSKN